MKTGESHGLLDVSLELIVACSEVWIDVAAKLCQSSW